MKGIDVVSCGWPILTSICSSSDPYSMVSDGTRSVSRRKALPHSSVASKFSACMRPKRSASRRSKDDDDRRNPDRRHGSSTCLLSNVSGLIDGNISSDQAAHEFVTIGVAFAIMDANTWNCFYGIRNHVFKRIDTSDGSKQLAVPQVIVLKVSIHCRCRGCEDKLTKHLSRIEGVTSLEVDLAANKVLIIGDVAPSMVLGCLTKLRKMRFRTAVVSS